MSRKKKDIVLEDTNQEIIDSEDTTIFDPEIGDHVIFTPHTGGELDGVVLMKPKQGSTKWTIDINGHATLINPCYLRILSGKDINNGTDS